jgi:hypothetical protein
MLSQLAELSEGNSCRSSRGGSRHNEGVQTTPSLNFENSLTIFMSLGVPGDMTVRLLKYSKTIQESDALTARLEREH